MSMIMSFRYLNSCPCPKYMTLDLVHLNMLERIGDSFVSNSILSIDMCWYFQINLMILEPVLEYFLFEFLDFYMDALNVYDHVFTSILCETSIQICGLHDFWVLSFLSICSPFLCIIFLQCLQCALFDIQVHVHLQSIWHWTWYIWIDLEGLMYLLWLMAFCL